ncbi:MAG: hypothetical protein Q9220_001377 [cf. Caloplaca sp. 1 TL-2023]
MCFTDFNMAPNMPFQPGLESIGSVAANWARIDAEEENAEYQRYRDESPESEHVLELYGKAVHDEYLAIARHDAERAQLEKRQRQELKEAYRRRYRRFRHGCMHIFRSMICHKI